MNKTKHKICIIGLGYVGLPLAVEFGQQYPTFGFDISQQRIDELNTGYDKTLEITSEYLKAVLDDHALQLTTDIKKASDCNIYIITVPTPIDKCNCPDLTFLINASEMVAKLLKKGDIVIYESTVYPGATEEDCVPILEAGSGLKFNHDFFCGYSPERINPGDKEHTLTNIIKITSGSTVDTAKTVDTLYQSIINAGTYLVDSIKIAEAAKVIENSQRDINIAFVNELAVIFNKLDIDTQSVLEAAATKWNFLPFKPGLVGGHCIGIDPYYLTYKAQEMGYNPEMILASRRLNDDMGCYIANRVIKLMVKKSLPVANANVLVLGVTFKENCPDIRNSQVIDVIKELKEFNCNISAYDPWANKQDVKQIYGLDLVENLDFKQYQAIILAVAHNEFKALKFENNDEQVVFDIKSILEPTYIDGRL